MKRGTEKNNKKVAQNNFYKTNPSGGISLIVLVITIIVVIILAAAVIISLQNNNPMVEANKARIESDVANMQAIFTNTVGKVMAENQDVVTIVGGQLYTTPTGNKKTKGEATYQILGTDGTPVLEGKIIFGTGEKLGTTYYTGKELPLYGSDTKWSVDNQGLLSVEVGGVPYGEGANTDNPPVVEEGKIAESENPMLQSWGYYDATDFHTSEYKEKITKVKFAIADKVSESKIEAWDVSDAKDKSVMAWVEDDGTDGYILTIASKSKIIANTDSSYLFYKFVNLEEIENISLLDTTNVKDMGRMFESCTNLKTLGGEFNIYALNDWGSIFSECNNLSVTINLKSSGEVAAFNNTHNAFSNVSTIPPAKLIINYTTKANNIIDEIKRNKTEASNIVFQLVESFE